MVRKGSNTKIKNNLTAVKDSAKIHPICDRSIIGNKTIHYTSSSR